jgi:hypothetical protein
VVPEPLESKGEKQEMKTAFIAALLSLATVSAQADQHRWARTMEV